MAQKNYKISFCVVCMNRLHQLKETLLKNIIDNRTYDELEFIVLDYNSQDGMEEWVKENLQDYILSGKVIYYKTMEPDSWSPSHSKNMAFKLATGDIVCSIWADYYTGTGFANYVNDKFKQDDNIVLTPIDFYKTKNDYNPPGDVLGKVCVKRDDFEKIGGFDERMDRHGFEDYDFINRLEMVDVKRVLIEDSCYLQYIAHDDNERYLLTDNLEAIYVNYKTASSSEVILLYKDQHFQKGTMIDNFTSCAESYYYGYQPKNSHFEYSLKKPGWETGLWKVHDKNSIRLLPVSGEGVEFVRQQQNEHSLLMDIKSGSLFYCINDAEIINSILVFDHFYYTRRIMEKNLKNKTAVVNSDGFGNGIVLKNFQTEFPIMI